MGSARLAECMFRQLAKRDGRSAMDLGGYFPQERETAGASAPRLGDRPSRRAAREHSRERGEAEENARQT